jgi:CheY-like chemotaxis protein
LPDISGKLDRTTFHREVIRSLHHLFNPAELRKSDLILRYGLGNSQDGPASLRRIFMEAIESLKPGGSSSESKAWRFYQVLHYRFSENIAQKEVAVAMSKSIRQLRRIENQAIDVLVDVLWNRMPAQAPDRENLNTDAENEWYPEKVEPDGSKMPTSTQEITQLDQSMHADVIHLKNLVEGVLTTLLPVSKNLAVELDVAFPERLAVVSGKAVALRQGILSILAPLLSQIRGGKLRIQAETGTNAQTVTLAIQAFHAGALIPETIGEDGESIGFARLLIQSSGGILNIARQPQPGGHTLLIQLPALVQIKVLAIDDNADVLQLMQRYTWNTRYSLSVLKDHQNMLGVVEELSPQIIILDVMMTDIDGWELLGRLHENPRSSGISIIVCTILPQESLALALGAAGFLRKPVSRKAFLEALDQQAARLESGSK